MVDTFCGGYVLWWIRFVGDTFCKDTLFQDTFCFTMDTFCKGFLLSTGVCESFFIGILISEPHPFGTK